MSQELSRVEKVDLRSVWAHEQTGFSRWLVDNIKFLNEQLPFDLDPESLHQEARAGSFSVDIVGDAVSDETGEPFKVIVENQLEETDHKHLGQVLTYVAAYKAQAAVWITSSARPEHAKAVQWLNDEANIDAWLFEIEVIRIDQSRPAPILTRIVGPSLLSKKAKAERQADQADAQKRTDFWSTFLPVVGNALQPLGVLQGKTPSPSAAVSQVASGTPGKIHWQLWSQSHGSWACIRIDGETEAEAAHYFNHLLQRRTEIEQQFELELMWDAMEGNRTSVIRWNNPIPVGFRDDPETWPEAAEALAKAMVGLVKAADPVIRSLPPYVVNEVEGDIEGSATVTSELTVE